MRALKYNSLSQLVTVIVGFTITILLLESEALLRWAQRLEVGEAANIAVQTTGELHRVLQPLHIEWARREGLADLDRLGWSDDPARRQAAQRMDLTGQGDTDQAEWAVDRQRQCDLRPRRAPCGNGLCRFAAVAGAWRQIEKL